KELETAAAGLLRSYRCITRSVRFDVCGRVDEPPSERRSTLKNGRGLLSGSLQPRWSRIPPRLPWVLRTSL
ncbi:hypothetical protein HAX54_039110, partial [Datura stramonium]|nr:hypothetical protein [Datura stramonium]